MWPLRSNGLSEVGRVNVDGAASHGRQLARSFMASFVETRFVPSWALSGHATYRDL
jgi:hypothetical protein